jgi:glyceraldehyde-3-phosphate dehydrogenase/erythrose-4-phosphate dehydrogenase
MKQQFIEQKQKKVFFMAEKENPIAATESLGVVENIIKKQENIIEKNKIIIFMIIP